MVGKEYIMMKVHCFTYLDEYRQQQWPSELAARPLVGDWVESSSGMKLKVVSVTHSRSARRQHANTLGAKPEPILKVELHKSHGGG
jgi:hypothetical protein